ncbi:hypothetical protein [Acanthopleuribacter pedis]|uniref:Uncharacterized protein n=1 Tax=Acanthopleuribacter pedis TaxID=442870 RepID=A0A8J7U981_9BACT|nr:hypothetical protein [Acanthopleuribacter pedis]MBO1323391.1 hypothetical protein [Acanthopleuribacter pedis]
MIRRVVTVWLVVFALGQACFWHEDLFFLRHPGVYLAPGYRGIFFSSLVHAANPVYVKLVVASYHLGSLLLLPMLLMIARRQAALSRTRDYSGNFIGKKEFHKILATYQKLERRKRWRIAMIDRNRIWVGVDLLTGEDVYLSGEDIFKGIVIIGAQGMGKTSRFFKVIIKQLALDALHKTSFIIYTLKAEDSLDFYGYLKKLGHDCLTWAMCNVVDLALNRLGALQRNVLHGLLQSSALATGLGSRDPFWLNSSLTRMVEYLINLTQIGRAPTLGNAYEHFRAEVAAAGDDARMDQSLLETLNAPLGATTDAGTRVSVLYSPNHGGGLHSGPLYAAANSRFREITKNGFEERRTGNDPQLFPAGLYEVPAGVRLPFDWSQLLRPLSVILPPPGRSKPELFALNLIKMSLLAWISEDIASPDSKLLQTNPAHRHRLVLAQDEGHAFLALESKDGNHGVTDTQALAENRQAGQVNILATQSPSRLNKTTKDKLDDFLSVNSNYFFMGVNGEEKEKVLKIIGQVDVTRIRRSYGRSEDSPDRTVGPNGQLKAQSTRANVSETIHEERQNFISSELYSQFREGMALHMAQGKRHRVIYCPLHVRVRITTAKPWWQRPAGWLAP